MKLSHAISLLLRLSIASAAPTGLQAQNGNDPDLVPITLEHGPDQSKSFHCGVKTYTGHAIYLAVQYGVALQEAKQTRGRNRYPHSFENDNSKKNILSFPSYCPPDTNRQAFPLLSAGPYNGGKNNIKQGTERVVYYYEEGEIDFAGHAKADYCGIMTHVGAPDGGFLLC